MLGVIHQRPSYMLTGVSGKTTHGTARTRYVQYRLPSRPPGSDSRTASPAWRWGRPQPL